MRAFASTENPFGGVIPDPHRLEQEPQTFRSRLEHSVAVWREAGYKVVWLEIRRSLAPLIPVAVTAGFNFHHAEQDYVMMTRRLENGAYIPPHATHYIGAGGVVLTETRDLLVVSERYRRRGRGKHYKLPGGALRPGEHIADCVKREILEETGIRTRFESLVCLRHWHGYRFNKSDIYFVCRLSPVNRDIRRQSEEIAECIWIPVEQYLGRDDVHAFNKRIVQAALSNDGIRPTSIDGYGTPETHEFFMPKL